MKKKAFDDIDNVAANSELHMTVVDFAKQVYTNIYTSTTYGCCLSYAAVVYIFNLLYSLYTHWPILSYLPHGEI